jgi:ABC-type nitrate/sulfonate/bicarbonate transport system substrate-binding protein
MPYTVVVVTPDLAVKQPAAVSAIAKTIGEGDDFIQSDFNEGLNILKAEFPKIDGRAISARCSVSTGVFPAAA